VQCMDAAVAVQTSCGHEMCVLCAQAVCAMPNRAVVCPFCRQGITSVQQLPHVGHGDVHV
jgi:hypothetical protein